MSSCSHCDGSGYETKWACDSDKCEKCGGTGEEHQHTVNTKQANEIKNLRAKINRLSVSKDSLIDDVRQLKDKLSKARECLEWYADKNNIDSDFGHVVRLPSLNGGLEEHFEMDNGKKARAYIKDLDK